MNKVNHFKISNYTSISHRLILLFLLSSSWLVTISSVHASNEEIAEIQDSVIKIYTTQATPDYFTPWALLTPRQSTGTGAVIENNLIMTNAHVVANASYVQAQKHNDPRRYQARVVFISHEADLAMITVEEAGFFDDLEALPIGDLPEPLQEVSVYGYPIGGKSLSITKGILSRTEHQRYAHAGAFLLAGQIDAAINPGNSGGPVIVDKKIVGIVMQTNGNGRAENLGYFVPPSVIKHVLVDAKDGVNDGFPDLGFRTQNLESPSAKAAFGLSKDENGVVVIKVFPDSPAAGVLKENDVILSIDNFDIAEDGSIKIGQNVLTDFKYAIDLHNVNEKISLTYSRNGKVKKTKLIAEKAKGNYNMVLAENFDSLPQYYVYGGIVFVPLNMNLIKRWGSEWYKSAPINFLSARNEWRTPDKDHYVVALRILAADVNLGYHDLRNWIVDTVNGEPIGNFTQFANKLKNNTDDDLVFRNSLGYQIVINHEQATESQDKILSQYRIPAPYSNNLFNED